jgi:hypothetical protein
MAQYRVDLSAGGISEDDEGSYWGGVSQACRDPFTWFFVAIHFFLVCAQSFKDFLPSVSLLANALITTTNVQLLRSWTPLVSARSALILSRLLHISLRTSLLYYYPGRVADV